MRVQSLMEISPVALSPPCTVSSPLVSRSLVGLRQHSTLPAHAFYCEDSCSALISAATEPSIWMPSSESGLGMDSSPINSISPSTPGLSYSLMPMESSIVDHTVQMSSFIDILMLPPVSLPLS